VKRDHSGRVSEAGEKSSDVTVADEDLGVTDNPAAIKPMEKVVAAVTATGTDDGADVVALEHLFQLADATVDGTGKIHILLEN
jgi:hypothetical protein